MVMSEEAGVVMLAAPALPAIPQAAAAAGSIVASVTGGIALGGAVVGILAGIATVFSLVIFAWVTVRKSRRDYEQEIRDAEQRGEDRQREWTDYYKALAGGQFPQAPRGPRPHHRVDDELMP